MAKSSKPRKAYKPKKNLMNPLIYALEGSSKINIETRRKMSSDFEYWLSQFSKGIDCFDNWKCLRDISDAAACLAEIGIATDEESRRILAEGEEAVAEVWERYKRTNSWTLKASELAALRELADRHLIQCNLCSVSEYERAWAMVKSFRKAFENGQIPKGARVLTPA